jgi:hypothetical protein
MLGCSPDELANSSDPAARSDLQRICDVAQAGLYALSQDARLTESEQTHHALMLMGNSLQRMTQVLQAAQERTDGGTSP